MPRSTPTPVSTLPPMSAVEAPEEQHATSAADERRRRRERYDMPQRLLHLPHAHDAPGIALRRQDRGPAGRQRGTRAREESARVARREVHAAVAAALAEAVVPE